MNAMGPTQWLARSQGSACCLGGKIGEDSAGVTCLRQVDGDWNLVWQTRLPSKISPAILPQKFLLHPPAKSSPTGSLRHCERRLVSISG